MGFNQPATLNLPAATRVAVGVTRQACWPVWADQDITFTQMVTYRSQTNANPTVAASSEVSYLMSAGVLNWSTTSRLASADVVGFTVPTSTAPTSYAILGRDEAPAEYTYAPAGSNVYFVVSLPIATANNLGYQIAYEVWKSPGQAYPLGSVTGSNVPAGNRGSAQTLGEPISESMWIRPTLVTCYCGTAQVFPATVDVSVVVATGTLSYTASATTRGLATVSSGSKTVFFPLVQPAEFTNSLLPWYATRVTAAALLGTNVSQVLNKGGTVLGGRLSPNVLSMWEAAYSDISNLHPAEKAFLALETGLYTYCPPSTDLVFFTDYTVNTAAGAASCPVFALGNDSMYNKYFITAAAAAEQLACTASWHIEFRTSSALFQVGLSPIILEALHAAQLLLAEMGYFFENNTHKNLISRLISTGKKYAPLLGDVASAIHPAAGAAVKVATKALIPKPGPAKPKTTTAAASGMMGPGKSGKDQKKKGNKK